MKSLVVLVVFLTPGICIANGQSKGTKASQLANAEQEVRKLEREWLDAGQNRDAAAIQRILADDFIITFGDGSTRDKTEVLRRLRLNSTRDPNASDWTEDSKVRIYGHTAIITGRYMYKMRDKDTETVSASRYTDTYIKRNGRWQVVASHLSNIVKK